MKFDIYLKRQIHQFNFIDDRDKKRVRDDRK